jgi:hypothetical protein
MQGLLPRRFGSAPFGSDLCPSGATGKRSCRSRIQILAVAAPERNRYFPVMAATGAGERGLAAGAGSVGAA